MNCEEVRLLLPLHAGNDLATFENAELQAHLEGCRECREAAGRWRADRARIVEAAGGAEPPTLDPAVLDRMIAAAEATPREVPDHRA